jgi:hypothetical protein
VTEFHHISTSSSYAEFVPGLTTLRPRIEERFRSAHRRYLTEREFGALLWEFITAATAKERPAGSRWMFGLGCRVRLQQLLRSEGINIGRRDPPKPKNRPGSFAAMEDRARNLAKRRTRRDGS